MRRWKKGCALFLLGSLLACNTAFPVSNMRYVRAEGEEATVVEEVDAAAEENTETVILKAEVPYEYKANKMVIDFSGIEDWDTKIIDQKIYYLYDEIYNKEESVLNGSTLELTVGGELFNPYNSFYCYYQYTPTIVAKMEFTLVKVENQVPPTSEYADVPIDEEHFPDSVFRQIVSKKTDLDQDGILSGDEAGKVQRFIIEYYDFQDQEIKTTKGIEYFFALTYFACADRGIEELDVSQNTELEALAVAQNQLTTLELGKNEKLKEVYCQSNPLTAIHFENNPEMKILDCGGCKNLTELDISMLDNLETLYCFDSSISEITPNNGLKELYCYSMSDYGLDMKGFPNLEYLNCNDNKLTELDLSENKKLKTLYCSKNSLSTLDVSACSELTELRCEYNDLTELNLNANTKLKTLYCGYNQIKKLEIQECKALWELQCQENCLTEMKADSFDNLQRIECYNNQIGELYLKGTSEFYDIAVDFENLDELERTFGENLKNVSAHLDVPVEGNGVGIDIDIAALPNWDSKIWLNSINYSWIDSNSKKVSGKCKITDSSRIKLPSSTVDGSVYCIYQLDEEKRITVRFDFDLPEVQQLEVNYRTHVQGIGWQNFSKAGELAGTNGQSKRLEAIEIKLDTTKDLGVQYTTHCQTYGWLPWSANGEMNGTEGESKRLEAIKIQLTGEDADGYDIYYRVHAQNYGWLGWAKNGEMAGTAGLSKRLEAIQIVVVGKGEEAPSNDFGHIQSTRKEAAVTANGVSSNPTVRGEDVVSVAVRTHVQTYGWQGWRYNGKMSGTSGESKRLEGINIKLANQSYEGDIEYRTHLQNYGWMDWKKNGEMSGTSGESKRLEAIQIRLTGEMAEKYDVYYRVHSQKFGWLGWAKNGEMAGTAGYSYRLESIQVVLVPKGDKAPATSFEGVTGSASAEAYKQK